MSAPALTRRTPARVPPAGPAEPVRRPRRLPEHVVFGLLALLVVVLVFANQWGQFTPDTKPELYLAPGRLLVASLSSWQSSPYQAGVPNFNTGLAPVALVMWCIEALGAAPWATIRIWRSILLLLAGWGAVRLYRALAKDRANVAGRLAAAVAYVGNAFVVIGASSTPVLLPYALLPWLVVTLIRAFETPRSWKWPAAFGLVFFCMSGMQAGVVPLFLLVSVPCYVIYLQLTDRRSWWEVFKVLAKCASLVVAVSLYWLIPSLFATSTGATVAAETEDPKLVALTTSYAETLRLLGQWPMYGRSGDRLFLSKGILYVTAPLVVIATFCYPAAAALGAYVSRVRARVFGVILLAVAIPIMVGMFPPSSPSVYGRLVNLFFSKVPGGIAFRTTTKIAPVALLGLSILIALGAAELAPRLRRWWGVAVPLVVIVVVASTIPAWTNTLYRQGWETPQYWTDAATQLNAQSSDTRLMVVPGAAGGNYRWGLNSPDDLFPSIFSRPTVSRLTVSGGAIYPANYLSALDIALNTGRAQGSTVSTMSRYLGVSQVLSRADTKWEENSGARPSMVNGQLDQDPGLTQTATFGQPGQYTTAPPNPDPNVKDPNPAATEADAAIAPLTLYDVLKPLDTVRSESVSNLEVIDGDNFAIPTMAQLGLLGFQPSYRLVGSMTADDLNTALHDGGRLAITDTNRRRMYSVHRLDDAFTATLGPNGVVTGQTATSVTLWPLRLETQTVADLQGVASITATRAGRVFGTSPVGGPTAAFDGDLNSLWVASDFGGGQGQAVTVAFDQPRDPGTVTIDILPTHPAYVSGLTVSTDNWSQVVDVPRPQPETFPAVTNQFDRAGNRVTYSRVSDGGFVKTTTYADGAVANQYHNDQGFTTKTSVSVTPPPDSTGQVTVGIADVGGSGTTTIGLNEIHIAGVNPTLYARMPTTLSQLAAQLPADGQALLATTPLDVIMNRVVSTPGVPNDDEERVLNRIFTLPASRSFDVQVQVPKGETLSSEQLAAAKAPDADGCVPLGTIDGQPLRMRWTADSAAVLAQTSDGAPLSSALTAGNCTGPTPLSSGEHTLQTVAGLPLSTLMLRSVANDPGPALVPSPATTVQSQAKTEIHVHTDQTTGPFYLVTGQGFDPRWKATVDGKLLGPPVLVDGYSVGWRIDGSQAHEIIIRFGPQRAMNFGILLGGLAVIGCVILFVLPTSWRRRLRLRRRS